jgi:hypothetical protein
MFSALYESRPLRLGSDARRELASIAIVHREKLSRQRLAF